MGSGVLSPGEMWTFTADGIVKLMNTTTSVQLHADTANPDDPRTVIATNDPSSYF